MDVPCKILILTCSLSLCVARGNVSRAEWQQHLIRQGDGKDGWVMLPAQRQVLKYPESTNTMPFGMLQMDNGEVAIIGSRERDQPNGASTIESIIAFSKDGGSTWTDFHIIPGARGRPINFTDHGKGRLSFVLDRRWYSDDYGRTWPRIIDNPLTKDGMTFYSEGNSWVDRDDQGRAKTIFELGHHYTAGKSHPLDDSTVVLRRSFDDGQTWPSEIIPSQWKFTVEHKGKKWLRGVHEGAIVRAANGDLVAALRTGEPPKYFDGAHDDNLCGTAVSVSHDNGKSWSELQFLFQAGRHHANLQRLSNGELVCTLVVRNDIQEGKTASHRRGCDAVVSKDNGKTWNLDRRYELDSFDYLSPDGYWVSGMCGHIGAVALSDGYMISAYGNYRLGAAVLVKWQPDIAPAASH